MANYSKNSFFTVEQKALMKMDLTLTQNKCYPVSMYVVALYVRSKIKKMRKMNEIFRMEMNIERQSCFSLGFN